MTSHFSFGVPPQSTSAMGIRFSRKSPAVGSTNRHWPFGARIPAPLKARVAVSSRCCDSATALGFKVPPARDTGTALVGLGMAAPASVVSPAEPGPEEAVSVGGADPWVTDPVSSVTEAEGAEVASRLPDPLAVSVLAPISLAEEVVAVPVADTAPVVSVGAAVAVPFAAPLSLALPPAAAAPPKVKDWLVSPELHCATSSTLPLTVRHDPAAFSGWKERGPEPPLKVNSCELVTPPPASKQKSASREKRGGCSTD